VARRAGGLESEARRGNRLPVRARVLLSLQQTAGNRAVRRLVQRVRGAGFREGTQPERQAKNTTGLPDGLKARVESLSGRSIDHVQVHYNSSEPTQFGALAYTRGSEIHIAPGEERHLAHEAWHAVQQAEGRVQPTQTEAGVPVNEDAELEREADTMGEQARTHASESRSSPNGHAASALARGAPARPTPAAGAVAQLVRQNIPIAGAAGAITLAQLQAVVPLIDQEIAELVPEPGHPEIDLGFIMMNRIRTWRQNLTGQLVTLQNLAPGAAAYTQAQIMARDTPLMLAFHAVLVSASNLRNALNTSLTEYNGYKAKQDVASAAAQERKSAESKKEKGRLEAAAERDYRSPYADGVDKYDHELKGAPILVDGHFVIVVEHYQLKHNKNLGILQAGGPFIGKKGSSMPGDWATHKSDYAPQILAMARAAVARLNGAFDASTNITLEKQRTTNMEAYVSITRDGDDWIVTYHCNP
jgi:uncharacterized protein DUF4157